MSRRETQLSPANCPVTDGQRDVCGEHPQPGMSPRYRRARGRPPGSAVRRRWRGCRQTRRSRRRRGALEGEGLGALVVHRQRRRGLRKQILAGAAALLFLSLAGQVDAQKIYWSGWEYPRGSKLQRADLDGTNVEDLIVTAHMYPRSLALDLNAGKIYFVDNSQFSAVRRCNLDGSNVEDVHLPPIDTLFGGVAIDPVDRKVYWSNRVNPSRVIRANLDGTQVEDVFPVGQQSILDMAVDPIARKLYWTAGYVWRANLDGSNMQAIVTTGLQGASGIALDLAAGKVYWTDAFTDKIQRANLDGSSLEDLVTIPMVFAREIGLDLADGKMYWVHSGTSQVLRANLDGSHVEPLVSADMQGAWGMAVDGLSGRIYWSGDTRIMGADLNGEDIQGVVVTEELEPWGIALDLEENRVYFADSESFKIRRSNLDGSNMEDLVYTYPRSPIGIDLDQARGKVYWTEYDELFVPTGPPGRILRANLDGSNVEPLVGGELGHPFGLSLDLIHDRMYWVADLFVIYRANLDGSAAEPLWTTGGEAWDVAVDPLAGMIYWGAIDYKTTSDWLRRAETDGPNWQNLFRTECRDVVLDLENAKVYWGALDHERIRRVNLDGSQVENVVRVPNGDPTGIALDLRVPGDCNGDRAVTMTEDWPSFFGCFAGPEVEFTSGCACADPNGDRDVDLRDFAEVQRRVSSP